MSRGVKYERVQHAGHYAYDAKHPKYGRGHDLETWTYAQSMRLPVPAIIPSDAEFHHGFLANGVQYWVNTRRAPMTGTCVDCAAAVTL